MFVIREIPEAQAARILYQAEDRDLRRLPSPGRGRHIWIAAFVGDEEAGVACLWIHKRSAELKRCLVLPIWRGRGIGEALILHRLEVAREHGCTLVRVNAMHPRWFERNGWKLTRKTTRFHTFARVLWV